MADMRAAYMRAERFLPWNVAGLVYHAEVSPRWVGAGPQFWYRVNTRNGPRWLLVDPPIGDVAPAFDHAGLARALSSWLGVPVTADALPLDDLDLTHAPAQIGLRVRGRWLHWEPGASACAPDASPRPLPYELLSPDGRWAAFRQDHNLWVRELASGLERQLTFDGVQDNDYAGPTDVLATGLSDRRAGRQEPHAVWSPDSTRLLTFRLDQRAVRRMPLVQSTPRDGSRRPLLYTFRYALPGDADVPLATLLICDVAGGGQVTLQTPPLLAPCLTPWDDRLLWWSADGASVYFVRETRGYAQATLCQADACSGETRDLLTEHSSTWVDIGQVQFSAEPPVYALASGDLLWWSQRDGWGHLYRLSCTDGSQTPITCGEWNVRAIAHVDETAGLVWFSATGVETGRNPYYRHLYVTSLAGGAARLLTPEDADHAISFSPCGGWFVDCYSRIDLPPVSLLRRANGDLVRELEHADIDDLLATGWNLPERLECRARDDATPIYGMLLRPSTFDPACRYPLLDDVYPGPHNIRTPTRFPLPESFAGFWQAQALAELGFLVLTLDGLGTGFRARALQHMAWGPGFGEAGGLPDHVHALRQLARERPYLDPERVGVYGHSGGGFAAARAMLLYPEVFRVGVAASGNHDQRGYHAQWGEQYLGADISRYFADAANSSLAARLTGKLLLIHGELDDDVHPAMTLQLVDALVQANRDVDLLIVPNANHDFVDPLAEPQPPGSGMAERYVVRRRWDYFVRHLLERQPPDSYLIQPPDTARGGPM
ncbi:MAG: peptidase S9 [Chloroflexi bacterium]|nr:MAG: peptidase S9 [Chloroflexota bacterium]